MLNLLRGLSLQFRLVGARETHVGNRCHTAATAETKGYWIAAHHAADSQPQDRSGSAVWCPAPRRCAPATRFQQWSARRPFRPNIQHGRGNRQTERHLHVVPAQFVRGQSIRQRPPGTATQNSRFGGVPRALRHRAPARAGSGTLHNGVSSNMSEVVLVWS